MSVAYDKHYLKADYFGKPYPELIKYFDSVPKDNFVLDLGCGQGRDSIALGKMGFRVRGVDISRVGIEQLNIASNKLKLNVNGVVGDLYTYTITEEYDIVLLDSILHFYKNDLTKEKELVKRIIMEMKTNSILCIFIQEGKQREIILKDIFADSKYDFDVLVEKHIDYPDFKGKYFMYILLKVEN